MLFAHELTVLSLSLCVCIVLHTYVMLLLQVPAAGVRWMDAAALDPTLRRGAIQLGVVHSPGHRGGRLVVVEDLDRYCSCM